MGMDNKCDTTSCNGNCDSCDGNITVTLTLDNDENGENEDGEVFIYRYDNSQGSPVLENIEDDEEYEAVADAFDEILDAAEFDELVEEEMEESDSL